MSEQEKIQCPECDASEGVGRREFLAGVGGTAVTLAGLELAPSLVVANQPAQPRVSKPAEAMIRELYQGLTAEQRRRVVYAWNHGAGNNQPATRLRMYNAAIFGPETIGAVYTQAQQELNMRILRSICSDDEGFARITRNNTFDGSGSFARCGAFIFGDPTNNQQFSWVFTGHHLTVRCDGNSEPNTAFGGPMYYGHSPDGFSQRNVFNFQTRSVLAVWDALTAAQRQSATMAQYVNPREQAGSVRHRRDGFPGVAYRDLTADQRRLIDTVMRNLISPYRREDGDEVMDLIRRNGGMERIHLGFYRDANTAPNQWDFWRLEGPGFVWNYRVLPHVHCFVNIALQQPAAPAAPGSR
ncbi:MAG: DUF3500 domain-containing protein [Planctomycetes bacterium]|nr:DUF3500 domain-containing protein [Planctomycetota bacterium]